MFIFDNVVCVAGACYYDSNQSMYVFGGCTQSSCNAAFNDLWRLDLNSKEWIRPLASGQSAVVFVSVFGRGVSSVSHGSRLVLCVQDRIRLLKPEPRWSCTGICWCCSAAGRGPVRTRSTSPRGSSTRSTRTRPPRTGERRSRFYQITFT